VTARRPDPAARLVVPGLWLPQDGAPFDLEPFLSLAARGVGGFCGFGGARATLPGILARLQEAAPHRLLLAGDFEDGVGQQVHGLTRHPPAAVLDPEAAERAGVRTAVEARGLGFTMVFAPVADVCSNPDNPIVNARAFPDPVVCAPAFVRGARRFGLRTCAKHFPGHGATSADSHDALPRIDADGATWHARDLPPFAACVEAGVDAVMTAHIAGPALTGSEDLPATLSRAVMTDLLRGELGFEGIAVTDALLMDGVLQGRSEAEAAVAALEAGCDVLLCPREPEPVLAAVAGRDVEAALARLARCANPLPDPLDAAAARAVRVEGDVNAGEGAHPLRVFDPLGGGEELAAAGGWSWERIGGQGGGAGRGFAVPVVAVLRPDRAWSGGLELPGEAVEAARNARILVVLGPERLVPRDRPDGLVHDRGQDPATLSAVVRALRGGGAF